jgi:hypothetical protein
MVKFHWAIKRNLAGGGDILPPRLRSHNAGAGINRSSSGKDSASSSLDEGNSTSSWGSRGGKGSRGNDKLMSCGNGDTSSSTDDAGSDSSENKGKEDILEEIWPGTHDPHLLTWFISSLFSGNWTAYLPFARWVDVRSMTALGVPIWLDNWLKEEEYKVDDNGRDGRQRVGLSQRWFGSKYDKHV